MSISGLHRDGGQDRENPERSGPAEQEPSAADPVSQRSHRDERAGDEKAVDVDDPEELGAGGMEVRADLRDCQVENGQVHHVQQARQGEDAQANPFASGCSGWLSGHGRDGTHVDRTPRCGRSARPACAAVASMRVDASISIDVTGDVNGFRERQIGRSTG
jgi:hypothetical protein